MMTPRRDRRPLCRLQRRCCHLSLLGILLFASTGAWAETPTDEAKRAFSTGVILLQDPDGARYEEAIVQFRKAFDLIGSWKVLGNIGLCAMKLERDGEAISAYEKYLAEGKSEISADERSQIERDLAAMRAQVVRVHLDFDAADVTLIDERTTARGVRIRNSYTVAGTSTELLMHPGDHVIVAKSARGDEARWETALKAGSAKHKFLLGTAASGATRASAGGRAQTDATSDSSHKTLAFVIGGAGVVTLGVGTAFALQRQSKLNERDQVCPALVRCTDAEITQNANLTDEARSAGRNATIGFLIGGAALVTGGVLFFTSGGKGVASGAGAHIAPVVAASFRGVEVGGSF